MAFLFSYLISPQLVKQMFPVTSLKDERKVKAWLERATRHEKRGAYAVSTIGSQRAGQLTPPVLSCRLLVKIRIVLSRSYGIVQAVEYHEKPIRRHLVT